MELLLTEISSIMDILLPKPWCSYQCLSLPETDGPLCAISGCVNLPVLMQFLCHHLAGECRLLCMFETEENASKRLEQEGRKPNVTLMGDGHAPCQKAVLDFLGELFVCSSSFPPSLILNEFAGGMFHYRDGTATYGLKNNCMTLYMEADDNQLLNDLGCYILYRLHKVQNMQEYALPPVWDTDHVDIDKYVSYSKTLEDGTTIYSFSKELLAYLKTLVVFSPYYYADDP